MLCRKSILLFVICCVFLCSSVFAAYIDNGDGTVTDTDTGLMWQQATAPGTYTWEQALAYCENLELSEHTDWRLPTAKELASIVDTSRYNPAINTSYFPDTVAANYFSSTTNAAESSNALMAYFDVGGYLYLAGVKNDGGYVRAVRGGESGSFDNLTLWPVPDTGQSTCYDNTVGEGIICPQQGQAFYGQDASYSINTPAYTKLAAGCAPLPDTAISWVMVRDDVTGLVWEEKHNYDHVINYADPNDADNTYSWYNNNSATNGGNAGTPGDGTDTMDFITALNAVNYGGFSDWRMPTVKELQSIVDYGRRNLIINTVYFPNTYANNYWSSTTLADYSDNAWYVLFWCNGVMSYVSKSAENPVRAVRTGQCGPSTTTTIAPTSTTTTTAPTECQIKSIQPSGVKIGFGLLPRIRRVTLTMNTDLESLGITCADLYIQNAPRGMRIISCAVVDDTIQATILFWGVQPGTYNINLDPCGSIPFVVARF